MIEPDVDLEMLDMRLTPANSVKVFSRCNIVIEALDSAEAKKMLIDALLPSGRPLVSAAGLAGWGRSNDIRVRRVGRNLILVGDQTRDVRGGLAPVGVRVCIAAAMEANCAVSLLLGEEL